MKVRPDPVAEFRDFLGETVDFEEPFVLLVSDQLNRNPMFADSFVPIERQRKFYVLKRSKFSRRSAFFREELEKADSSSSDPNTPKRVDLENHMPEDFDAYLRYINTGSPSLATDNAEPLFPLLRLYVLVDELCDFTMANLVLNNIIRASDEFEHIPSKKEI